MYNKGLKFKSIVTNAKQFKKQSVDTAIVIGNITNSEDKSYLRHVCIKIMRGAKSLVKHPGTPQF